MEKVLKDVRDLYDRQLKIVETLLEHQGRIVDHVRILVEEKIILERRVDELETIVTGLECDINDVKKIL